MSNKCSYKKCENDIGENSITVGFGTLCPECTKSHKIFMDKWAEETMREFDMQTVRIIEAIVKGNDEFAKEMEKLNEQINKRN